MEKIYLTDLEQDLLDPSKNCRNLITRIPLYDEFAPLPPHIQRGEEFLEATNRQLKLLSGEHKPYVQYAISMIDKCGRQGGMFNRQKWESQIEAYFAGDQETIPDALIIGRDLFIKMIREKIDKVGRPQLRRGQIIPTFGGLPSGLAKGSFAAETLERNHIGLQKFLPTIPGQRRMRGKDRVIFMDATVNVRAQEPYLNGARIWFKENFPEFFSAWTRDDIHLRPGITRAIDRRCAFANADYKSMDVNFRKRIAMELIYPIYCELYPDMALTIGAHFEQNFEQDIYLGKYLLRGLHSILSGANITNDFETLYSIILILGALAILSLEAEFIAALGDDVTVAFRKRIDAQRFLNKQAEISDAAGMVLHPDKSEVTDGFVTFCRKTYYPAGKRDECGYLYGAYPSPLCVNNIIQPENPTFEAGEAFRSDLQRLDGLIGNPDADFVIQKYIKHSKNDLLKVLATDDWYASNQDWRDWWFRVYNESWSPASSWALIRLVTNLPLSKPERAKLISSLLKSQ